MRNDAQRSATSFGKSFQAKSDRKVRFTSSVESTVLAAISEPSANRTPVATVAQLNAAVAQAKAQGRDAIALFVQRGPNGIFIAVKFKK